MKIEKSFVVRADPAAVWAFLTDPYRVAPCLPGAAITEKTGERVYAGTITVKVGPVAASYKGKLRFERLDETTREAEIVASGQDIRGKGGADMRMTSRVSERAPGETEVVASSEVNVTGILAQLGRGMIQDVSDQMFQRFTDAMRQQLEAAPAGVAPSAASPSGTGPSARSPSADPPAAYSPSAAASEAPAPGPAAAASAPIEVVSFGSALLGHMLLRMLRSPAFWIVAAVLVLFLLGFRVSC
jgi:carbon monoxide dehydrogenase subunit G